MLVHTNITRSVWPVVALETVAFVERGKFTARPRNDPKYFGGDIPFLQTGDVSGSNGVVNTHTQTLNDTGLSVSKLFAENTLLITIAANIGDVAKVPFVFACTDSLVAVTARQDADQEWLRYFLSTKKSYFKGRATQNAQANINLQTIRPLEVPLPPLPEQKAIASVLQCWDRGIEKLEAKLAAKERVKQGLMQELLSGQIRLPGFGEEARMEDGEWRIPEGWEMIPLGELGRFSKGMGISKAELSTQGLPCLRYGEIYTTTDFILNSFRSFISRTIATGSKRIQYNDLLFAGSGETAEDIGKCLAYIRENEEAYAGGDIVILSVNKKVAKADYLSYFLNTAGRKQLNRMGQGQSVVHLYSRDLSKVNVPLPPLDEQKATVRVLSAADREIDALRRKLDVWKAQKQYLLNHLVDGTIRLPQFVESEKEVAG